MRQAQDIIHKAQHNNRSYVYQNVKVYGADLEVGYVDKSLLLTVVQCGRVIHINKVGGADSKAVCPEIPRADTMFWKKFPVVLSLCHMATMLSITLPLKVGARKSIMGIYRLSIKTITIISSTKKAINAALD